MGKMNSSESTNCIISRMITQINFGEMFNSVKEMTVKTFQKYKRQEDCSILSHRTEEFGEF